MSRGNPTVQLRVSPLYISSIKAKIRGRKNDQGKPMTVSDFVFKALQEKLAHLERSSRKCRKEKTASTSSTSGVPAVDPSEQPHATA